MNRINIYILDLPDEILLTIFNKVNNTDLLYSLMGINEKLDRITCDNMFTKDIDLTTVSSNGTNDSKLDIVVDRFCTYIFPRIHNNVESLGIQASMFHRILHADYYPNLHKLSLLNVEIDMASDIFNENSLFMRSYKHKISHLVMTISDESLHGLTEIIIAQIYIGIFTWLSNLQYLDLDCIDGSLFSGRLLGDLCSTICYCSNINHLRIRIHNFDDCLCLLDGRLSQLHTLIVKLDDVHYSQIVIKNEDTLLKLKCFSFYVNRPTLYFDFTVAPLLRRMSNLEKLTLSLSVRRRNSFIDGIYLTDEICSSMPHLHTFIFDIVSYDTIFYVHPKPSSDDVRQTFIENGYHVDCYIDYCTDIMTDGLGRCHIYSLPFTMEHIQYISSRFPGGIFGNVRVLRVVDTKRSFGKTFFAKISRSFPLLTRLTVSNTIEQVEKPSWRLKKFNETSSIITYPHLAELVLSDIHIDYVEQFLFSFNTCLPCLNSLDIRYEHLTTVTENFTRDATRMNCAKVKRIVFNRVIHLGQSRNFYLYFPSLKKYCPM
ncbi:unnamed protein product [Adineta steineri]|uniref:F-box domain-containing protein n=1 Tax=Adineta steineri TaxID=433720 RepID=A0A815LF94_9BILA|nr:unnamed protein product [Adineta steineri]CAF1531076.1 unnamed protein product [Adineta steineri]